MATGSEHWRKDSAVFLPAAQAVKLCSHSLSGHTVNIAVTFVLSPLGCFLVPPTAVLCWPSCQGCLRPCLAGVQRSLPQRQNGGKSMGYGLPRTGSLGEQQVVMEVQGAGDRQELAWGLGRDRAEAGMGLGSRILSATAEGSPK